MTKPLTHRSLAIFGAPGGSWSTAKPELLGGSMTIPQNRVGLPIATPHHLSVSRDERRRALSEVGRRSNPIPGYTGHLDGHKVENVFGATFGEALLVGEAARQRRARGCLPGDPVLTNRKARTHNFDNGSLNTTLNLRSKHLPIENGHRAAPADCRISSLDHGSTGHTKVGASGLLLLHRLWRLHEALLPSDSAHGQFGKLQSGSSFRSALELWIRDL
eukprot:s232_g31.t1